MFFRLMNMLIRRLKQRRRRQFTNASGGEDMGSERKRGEGGDDRLRPKGGWGKRWGLKLVIGLVVVALAGQFYWSNDLAVAGGELASLRSESQRLEGENLELRSKIAEKEALEKIEQRAEELGMARATDVAKVKALSPLAYSGEGDN
jgi:hypothetical protein